MERRYKDRKKYIHSYVKIVCYMYGITPREAMVAGAMVQRYLESDKDNPMEDVKSKESILEILQELDMDIVVFRNYVKRIKDKGFFRSGKINAEFLPDKEQTSITIVHG